MSGVFDQVDAVLVCNGPKCIQLDRMPGVVDGDDGFCRGRNRLLDGIRPDVQSVRFYIHQNRTSADVFNHVDRCSKRHRRRNHFIARADVQHFQRDVQSCRAGIQRQSRRSSDHVTEFLFESASPRAGCEPAGLQCFHDFIDFFAADQRQRKRQKLIAHK